MRARRAAALAGVVGLLFAALGSTPATAAPKLGTTFPAGFDVPVDASLKKPVIGFGSAEGEVKRTPVIFLHGNNDTPYPHECNYGYGKIHSLAQHLADNGYSPKELWGLGYQGDQCDLRQDQSIRASVSHSTVANVPDLRSFVDSVLRFTGAEQVDIVGHSLGGVVPREWMRQDNAYAKVRRLVTIDSPHHGIINCSPSPLNYYVSIGFNPDSAVCQEYGSDKTPLLTALSAGDETPGPTEYLSIRNADTSFVYFSKQDGVFPPVPAQDRTGKAHDFSTSARLEGAENVDVSGQGQHDETLLAAHLGILDSTEVWDRVLRFLRDAPSGTVQAVTSAPDRGSDEAGRRRGSGGSGSESLPSTGSDAATMLGCAALVVALLGRRLVRS